MPSTPNQGFPYPHPDDPPNVPADFRDLAEILDTKVTALDATVASLSSTVTAIEDGTGGAGWIPIASGAASGISSFDIDFTDGGRFPSPPLWAAINVRMVIDLNSTGQVVARVNGETATNYTSGSFMMDSQVPANSDSSNWHATSPETVWRIAQISTVNSCRLDLNLYGTDQDPGPVGFTCWSGRQSADATIHRNTLAHGAVIDNRTLTSLRLLAGGDASTIANVRWYATGLRMAAP